MHDIMTAGQSYLTGASQKLLPSLAAQTIQPSAPELSGCPSRFATYRCRRHLCFNHQDESRFHLDNCHSRVYCRLGERFNDAYGRDSAMGLGWHHVNWTNNSCGHRTPQATEMKLSCFRSSYLCKDSNITSPFSKTRLDLKSLW